MSLAQDFLDANEVDRHVDLIEGEDNKERLLWAYATVTAGLQPPVTSDPDLAEYSAEKFVFDIKVDEFVDEMKETKQIDWHLPQEIAQFPASRTWLEYPVDFTGKAGNQVPGRVGALLAPHKIRLKKGDIDKYSERVAIIVQQSDSARAKGMGPFVIGCFSYIDPLPWPVSVPGRVAVHWWNNDFREDSLPEDMGEEIKTHVRAITDCLFLLNVPRAVELQEQTWGPKKQRKRAEQGKPPLVETKRVVLRIGEPQHVYQRATAGGAGSGHKKRLHRVVGHLRVYREGRETPLVRAIPGYWRGDPTLGVLLHERTVKGPKNG